MSLVLTMRRRALKLEPVTPYEEDLLAELPEGRDLTVEIKRQRSVRQNNFFRALLRKVVENHNTYNTPDQLILWLKVRLGYVDEIKFHDGGTFFVAKSTSFNSMGQDEFRMFFDQVLQLITTEVIVGINTEELVREVELMMGYQFEDIWRQK